MPNIAALLREEITRLARKEVRTETEQLKKTVVALRHDVAALKRQVRTLESELYRAVKARSKQLAKPVDESSEDASHLRFSAKGLASNRRRLGLSADDFALLVGTTGQSIYAWESGHTKPRASHVAAIASLRSVGKREVTARLSALKTSKS